MMASDYSACQQSTELSPKWTVELIPNSGTENLSSYAPISSEDPGFGKLSRLPREIRNMIWKEFLPQNNYDISAVRRPASRNTQLAVLRTSRRIYREVGSQIYPTGLKPFIISVTPEYKYESWVTISNGKKNAIIWKLGSLKEAIARGFLHIGPRPVAFRVEIEAPDRDDPGQLICLSEKVRHVVEMLRLCIKCPRGVEINFKNGKKGKWFIDGKPTTTNLDVKPCGPDYRCILLSFCQLRNIKQSEVKIPEDINQGCYDLKILRKIEQMMKQTVPFGEIKGSSTWSDSSMRSYLKNHASRCEQAISRLSGWTAMMLRLECFLDYDSSHNLGSKDSREGLKHVLRQLPDQEYMPWGIRDDAIVRRLMADEDQLFGTMLSSFCSSLAQALRALEYQEESPRNGSSLPS